MALVKRIVQAAWHRNGVGGEGFYAVVFEPDAEADYSDGNMLAIMFDPDGTWGNGKPADTRVAVIGISRLANPEVGVAFGDGADGNSWRGDNFARELRPLLNAYLKDGGDGSVRAGPFGIPTERRR